MSKTAIYERNLTGSYMKLQADGTESLDEKIVLKCKPKGLLAAEKCFVDGCAEYWYQITGKQSVDSYCCCNTIGIAFVEKVITGICSEAVNLEKYMLNPDGLLLLPEYLFVDNSTQELCFTFYPGEPEPLSRQFQRLMEYLLTKIDHQDANAVRVAYGLYEKTLEEGYSIWDIQNCVMENRIERGKEAAAREEAVYAMPEQHVQDDREKFVPAKLPADEANAGKAEARTSGAHTEYKSILWKPILENEGAKEWLQLLSALRDKLGLLFNKSAADKKEHRKKDSPKKHRKQIVYFAEDAEEEQEEIALHPTICLSDYREKPDGLLLYEGYENFKDIRLEKKSAIIGKGEQADIRIEKDTVSHIHAKLSYENEAYYLEDLNSTNGCMVNGRLLSYREKQKLSSNDILVIADVKYRFL